MTHDVTLVINPHRPRHLSPRDIQRRENAAAEQIAMMHSSAINVSSYNLTRGIDPCSQGKDCTGEIERCVSWETCIATNCESQAGQRHPGEPHDESFRGPEARDRLGHTFC